MFLRNKFKIILTVILCTAFFLGVSYVYLNYSFNKQLSATDIKENSVPYERIPENQGIAFVFSDDSAMLVYLDFKSQCIRLINVPQFKGEQVQYSGYNANFTVHMDYDLIEGIVDRIGGVNLNVNEQTFRYTGVQVVELLLNNNNETLKKQLITEIFNQISKNDFSKDDFIYIIENSKNNLSVIDCIYWIEHLKNMSGKISFID